MQTKNHTEQQLPHILLGQNTNYPEQYDASILYPVPRQLKRSELGLIQGQRLPFYGVDVWHGYELSWLNPKGKPEVALARFSFPFDSANIVESKSFKLYLNSFNQTRFDSFTVVRQRLVADLSATTGGVVEVTLYRPDQLDYFTPTPLPGDCIDDCDITVEDYHFSSNPLEQGFASTTTVTETLHSHLLKSNCLITNQPDWASVVVRYSGRQIDHEALLRYLLSFRQHNEFHEQCVERIFNDIWTIMQPEKLAVNAYYTRRGGLDINPCRSSEQQIIPLTRTNRQ